MKEVLFLGNIPTSDPRSIGGATTLTKNLLESLETCETLKITKLKTRNNWGKGGQILDFLLLPFKVLFFLRGKSIVSIHASQDFHFTVGPIIYVLSRILRKKVVYHFFGGSFHNQFQLLPTFGRWWLKKTIFSSDYVLLETKKMIVYFENQNVAGKCIWFPNARKQIKDVKLNLKFRKRFVFISRVTRTKGIDLLLEVVEQLPNEVVLDIYGPIDNTYYSKETFNNSRLVYKGLLKADEVNAVLNEYDVVVLPTYYKGEGYPGILIEGMSLGKPIITSRLNALDEIVIPGFNGLLIDQKSASDLMKAILYFDEENYPILVKNSIEKFLDFDIQTVAKKLIEIYNE